MYHMLKPWAERVHLPAARLRDQLRREYDIVISQDDDTEFQPALGSLTDYSAQERHAIADLLAGTFKAQLAAELDPSGLIGRLATTVLAQMQDQMGNGMSKGTRSRRAVRVPLRDDAPSSRAIIQNVEHSGNLQEATDALESAREGRHVGLLAEDSGTVDIEDPAAGYDRPETDVFAKAAEEALLEDPGNARDRRSYWCYYVVALTLLVPLMAIFCRRLGFI